MNVVAFAAAAMWALSAAAGEPAQFAPYNVNPIFGVQVRAVSGIYSTPKGLGACLKMRDGQWKLYSLEDGRIMSPISAPQDYKCNNLLPNEYAINIPLQNQAHLETEPGGGNCGLLFADHSVVQIRSADWRFIPIVRTKPYNYRVPPQCDSSDNGIDDADVEQIPMPTVLKINGGDFVVIQDCDKYPPLIVKLSEPPEGIISNGDCALVPTSEVYKLANGYSSWLRLKSSLRLSLLHTFLRH